MRALKSITGHVIFKLRYNQIYQLKTTHLMAIFDRPSCTSSVADKEMNGNAIFQEKFARSNNN